MAKVEIRDRIRELRRVRASDLIANPKNWRRHPTRQVEAMKGVLREIGYADALLARETDEGLVLIDGHLRASVTPATEVPVLVLDVTEAEADTILATLDPLAAMAETDAAQLRALLEDVSTGEAAVQEMLAGMAEVVMTEPIPDIPGYDAPPTAHRLIILCETEDEVQQLADALHLTLKTNVVAYPFADVTLPDG